MRRAKIVCTLGPATDSPENVQALVDAGMNVARINRSHGRAEDQEDVIARVRAAAKGHSRLRRTRREKVRRRRILARDAEWRADGTPVPQHRADTATGQSTSIISTNEQKKYLE